MTDKPFTRQAFSPPSIAAPFGQYSHGVILTHPGRCLVTSGQLAITNTSKGNAIPESALEQARLCFSNIREILKQADMTAADVVRIGAYVTDRAYFEDYMQARDEFVSDDPPASTLIIVSGFTRPEFKVEVEVLAAAP